MFTTEKNMLSGTGGHREIQMNLALTQLQGHYDWKVTCGSMIITWETMCHYNDNEMKAWISH